MNPALYDLLQNGVLQASEEFQIARTSCEELVGKMEQAIGNDRWETVAKGRLVGRAIHGWRGNPADQGRRRFRGRGPGVVWVGGGRRGGRNQPPIEPVDDAARAGYNLLLNRTATNTTSATATCAGAAICEEWENPQAFADWTVRVVGDKSIRTCTGCDKIEVQAGMGPGPRSRPALRGHRHRADRAGGGGRCPLRR